MANDLPQVHSWVACGFTTFRPPPSMRSRNSSVEPWRIGALRGSTTTRRPWASSTWSASAGASSRSISYSNPSHPPATIRMRSTASGRPWRPATARTRRAAGSVMVRTGACVSVLTRSMIRATQRVPRRRLGFRGCRAPLHYHGLRHGILPGRHRGRSPRGTAAGPGPAAPGVRPPGRRAAAAGGRARAAIAGVHGTDGRALPARGRDLVPGGHARIRRPRPRPHRVARGARGDRRRARGGGDSRRPGAAPHLRDRHPDRPVRRPAPRAAGVHAGPGGGRGRMGHRRADVDRAHLRCGREGHLGGDRPNPQGLPRPRAKGGAVDAADPSRVDEPTGPSEYTGRDWPAGVQDPQDPSVRELRAILGDARTIAVVGLSNDRTRDAYDVAEYIQRKGYRIVPVNPSETEVLGEKAYPSLLDVPEKVDVVDVFRRADK